MLFLLLALLDLITGFTIIFSIKFLIPLIFILILIKGIYSLLSSLTFPCILTLIMSLIDLAAGISLYFLNLGISGELTLIIGILISIKGIYSLFISFK